MLDFVNAMAVGIPELDIPAFDPWTSNNSFPFPVQDNTIVLRADVNATYYFYTRTYIKFHIFSFVLSFRKVESIGFSSANITSHDINADGFTYDISIALPDLNLKGNYSVVSET